MYDENKTFEEVARRCSEYTPSSTTESSQNSTKDADVSCTTCSHFDTDSYCDLDLYKEIAINHNL